MTTRLLSTVVRACLCVMVLVLGACGGGGGGASGPAGSSAPSGLSYTTPTHTTLGVALTSLSPSVTGVVTSYSVSPALPAGLALATSTGVISGTPTAVTALASYTITATNAAGQTTFALSFAVDPVAPTALSYTSPAVATVGTALAPLTVTVTGNVDSYAVSPALPAGLAVDPKTGVIAGTPTTATAQATYTITATNAGGSTSFGVVLTVGAANLVTGVAATGGPLAGALVTLKDAAGHIATATTAADGSFSIDVTGFTAPFLLSVPSGATTLYSTAASPGVANLTPYTTVPLQAYYASLGTSAGGVFAGTVTAASVPIAAQLALLLQPFVNALQPFLVAAGVTQPTQFNPFTIVFSANHTTFDIVLDRTVLGGGSLTLTVDNGSGTTAGPLSAVLTIQVTAGSATSVALVSVNTLTTLSGGGSSSAQQVVPVGTTPAQQTGLAAAVSGVLTIFKNLGQLVTTKGTAIVASDVSPYVDPAYLQEGMTAAQWSTALASALATVPTTGSATGEIVRVNQYDASAQTLDVTVHLALTSAGHTNDVFMQAHDNPAYGVVYRLQSGGGWAFYGHQTPYFAQTQTVAQRFYDASSSTPDAASVTLNLQAQVSVPPGALTAANVVGPAASLPDCTLNPAPLTASAVTLVHDAGLFNGMDRWDLPCGTTTLAASPPAGGSLYTFSLAQAGSGTVVTQTYPLNGTTRDVGNITQINAVSRSSFAAGHAVPALAGTTLTVTFTPPATYPVLYSFITGFCQNAAEVASGGGANFDGVPGHILAGVNSGTLAIPAQCDAAAMAELNVGVWFIGLNGERSVVTQRFHP